MRRIRYNAATSLDGFIASPDGSTDWIVEDASIDFDALYAEFDIYVMGRKTYEVVTSYSDSNPLATKSKENVIVVSREMKQENYPNITILGDNFIDTIRGLKAQNGKDIWFMGGGQLAAPLLEAALIDVIEVAIMPAILGKGIKMIDGSDNMSKAGYKLGLVTAEKLDSSGIMMVKYAVCYNT